MIFFDRYKRFGCGLSGACLARGVVVVVAASVAVNLPAVGTDRAAFHELNVLSLQEGLPTIEGDGRATSSLPATPMLLDLQRQLAGDQEPVEVTDAARVLWATIPTSGRALPIDEAPLRVKWNFLWDVAPRPGVLPPDHLGWQPQASEERYLFHLTANAPPTVLGCG